MKLKLIKGLIGVLFVFVLMGGAYAQSNFDNLFMTDGFSSVTQKTSFGWDETPWLYMRLPHPGMYLTEFVLTKHSGEEFFNSLTPRTDPRTDILNPEEWFQLNSWNDIKDEGEWHISARFFYPPSELQPPDEGFGTTSFTVTPEPISTFLFLTGGTALVIRSIRRKKINK